MHGVAVFGVTGRMGQALVRLLSTGSADVRPSGSTPPFGLRLCGAIAAPSSSRLGQDAAADGQVTGIRVTDDAAFGLQHASVAVDFSRAQLVVAHAQACASAGVPLLVGTTGYDSQARAALEAAALRVAVLPAANTSLGVAVMARLVKLATSSLGPEFDVEIVEAHHRGKRDAPSGTALSLGKVVAAARDQDFSEIAVFDRHGSYAPRATGSIGFSVQRAGDIVGEHTVVFAATGERLEITHRATDRATFAVGALRAAAWLVGRSPGLYAMEDVLDLA